MILKFKHPHMPPTLNGNGGLLRMHWSKRKQVKDKFIILIREALGAKRDLGNIQVSIVNYYIWPMDWDNLASRFKIVGDALVAIGYIKDDSPKVIVKFEMDQVRVKKKDEVALYIHIEPC